MVMDAVGASETGSQMSHMSAAGQAASTGTFTPGPGRCHRERRPRPPRSRPGHEEVGWLAQKGRVPLGYLGDADKTARTFPVIDGVALLGARRPSPAHAPTASIELLRARLGHHQLRRREDLRRGGRAGHRRTTPTCTTWSCAGRPSERWGQEVVAVVQLRDGATATEEDLLAEAATHVARYKLPEGVRVPRRDRPLARRQGRLPLGQGAGRAAHA